MGRIWTHTTQCVSPLQRLLRRGAAARGQLGERRQQLCALRRDRKSAERRRRRGSCCRGGGGGGLLLLLLLLIMRLLLRRGHRSRPHGAVIAAVGLVGLGRLGATARGGSGSSCGAVARGCARPRQRRRRRGVEARRSSRGAASAITGCRRRPAGCDRCGAPAGTRGGSALHELRRWGRGCCRRRRRCSRPQRAADDARSGSDLTSAAVAVFCRCCCPPLDHCARCAVACGWGMMLEGWCAAAGMRSAAGRRAFEAAATKAARARVVEATRPMQSIAAQPTSPPARIPYNWLYVYPHRCTACSCALD